MSNEKKDSSMLIAVLGLLVSIGSALFTGLNWSNTRADRQLTYQLQAQRLLDQAYDLMGGRDGTTALFMEIEPLKDAERSQFELAYRKIRLAQAYYPEFHKGYSLEGVYWVRQPDPDKAASLFEKAIKLDPNHWESYTHLGLVQLHLKKNDEAIKNLKKATELDASNWRPWLNLGWGYQHVGNNDLAQPAIRKAKELADQRGVTLPIMVKTKQQARTEGT